MDNRNKEIIILLLTIVIVLSLTAGLTMVLWNWTLPSLFGTPRLTFWHAVGITLLSYLIFPRIGSSK